MSRQTVSQSPKLALEFLIIGVLFAVPVVAESIPIQKDTSIEVAELVTVLRDADALARTPQKVAIAIDKLGQMKATQAVYDLVRLITFKRPLQGDKYGIETHIVTTLERYPAVASLVEIGEESLPVLIDAIKSDENQGLKYQNLECAILLIFREKRSEGAKRFRELASQTTPIKYAKRLLKVAQQLERLEKRVSTN